MASAHAQTPTVTGRRVSFAHDSKISTMFSPIPPVVARKNIKLSLKNYSILLNNQYFILNIK